MFYKNNLKKGFTLVELLIVIALIGILATLSVLALQNARQKTRDAERLSAISQIRAGVELGFAQVANYPTQENTDLVLGGDNAKILCESNGVLKFVSDQAECGGTVFLQSIPAAPQPADKNCNASQNAYRYLAGSGGTNFKIEFCLGKSVPQSGLADGLNCVTPAGIEAGACK